MLTGKYTRGSSDTPKDTKRAANNRSRLTERNLEIAREVDRVADELVKISAQVAIAWVRRRGERNIPIVGVRRLDQLWDVGSLEDEHSADQLARLHKGSEIEFRFPYNLLMGPQGQMVHGDLAPKIVLPQMAPFRSK